MSTNGGHGRGRPKFDQIDKRRMLAAHDAGTPVTTIAKRFGCTPGAVYYHLQQTGRHTPMKDRDYTPKGVAACIRCGIDMSRPGMCLDCCETEGVA